MNHKRKMIRGSVVKAAYAKTSYRCVYCRFVANQIEHIVPVSVGGGDDLKNLIGACDQCNQIVRDRVFRSVSEKKDYIWLRRMTGAYCARRWFGCKKFFKPKKKMNIYCGAICRSAAQKENRFGISVHYWRP